MTDQGAAFSQARYRDYLEAFDRLSEGRGEYSLPCDFESYALVAPLIDGLWASWVEGGGASPVDAA
jgi:hypothetical protein